MVGSWTSNTADTVWCSYGPGTSGTTAIDWGSDATTVRVSNGQCTVIVEETSIKPGSKRGLPDGGHLIVDAAGNYRIEDKDAKVTYKANRNRDFSPHLNASDMLAEFVADVGRLGVRREDVMGLPLQLFVAWLVIQAAERDGDEVPVDITPVERDPHLMSTIHPRCLNCGKFIKRVHAMNRFPFCSPDHGVRYHDQFMLKA